MNPVDHRDEAAINRVLRRADWRFLLPGAHFDRSICFADGLLAEAVAAVSDSVIEPASRPNGSCDLAVGRNPDQKTLQAAWGALRPGGACYMEWTLPFAGGPIRLRRQLESAGFTQPVCYWHWPWGERKLTLYWLPVESPHVVQYFLANRNQGGSFVNRIWNRLLELVFRTSINLGLMAPLSIIAQKPPANGTGVLDVVRTSRSRWCADALPVRLDWMLLTGGAKTLNKIVGLVFEDSNRHASLVVKMARNSVAAAGLAREAANLRELKDSLPVGFSGVPELLFSREWAGQTLLGETALTGKPIYTALRRDTFRDLSLKVTGWLANMAGEALPCDRSQWWDRLVETNVLNYERNFGDVLDPADLRAARQILARLGDLPLVFEQRDCSPWNILIDGNGGAVVLDWESAEPRGLPVLDLVYFLTYLVFFLDGAMDSQRFRESYRVSLDPATFTGSVVAECQQHYLERLGIKPEALSPLRLLTWMVHSQSEYRQLEAASNGRPDIAQLRGSLFVSLWQEELLHAST